MKTKTAMVIGIVLLLIGLSRLDVPFLFFLKFDFILTLGLIAVGIWLILEARK